MKKKIEFKEIFFSILIIVVIWQIIQNPYFSIESAKSGLYLWFNILLPSLFPFIFLSDLLISLGVVNYIGRYLEIIMKPLFNVSGAGIFPLFLSVLSGYPVGSKLTSKLRSESKISKAEADRLITFTSTSGPLFLLGTVLIGMLQIKNISGLLLIPHYLGAITVGLIFRNYQSDQYKIGVIKNDRINNTSYKKPEPIGLLISNSIRDSIESILTVGGFVIIYSVVINSLLTSSLFLSFINLLSVKMHINSDIIKGLIAGIIEMTNGCNIISSLQISTINKILLMNFLIGWGGLSIHSQALSFISKTDISSTTYLIGKLMHGLISALYTYILYLFIYKEKLIPTFNSNFNIANNYSVDHWLKLIINSSLLTITLILGLSILSTLFKELRKRA